jgi:hypothetical protein
MPDGRLRLVKTWERWCLTYTGGDEPARRFIGQLYAEHSVGVKDGHGAILLPYSACQSRSRHRCTVLSSFASTYKLKMMPYGPAGIDRIPNGLSSVIAARLSKVDTTVEMSTNACN